MKNKLTKTQKDLVRDLLRGSVIIYTCCKCTWEVHTPYYESRRIRAQTISALEPYVTKVHIDYLNIVIITLYRHLTWDDFDLEVS